MATFIPRFAGRPLLLGLLLTVAMVIAGRPHHRAVAGVVYTVNSTANTDDGDCNATCTLREAIHWANKPTGNGINFDTLVFPPDNPGVINVEGGMGCLPNVTNEIFIDGRHAGVIIDGDAQNNGTPIGCGIALRVTATENDFSFSLAGDSPEHFIVREFGGSGIGVVGGGFTIDQVLIDSIRVTDVTAIGVGFVGTPTIRNAVIDDSYIEGVGGDGILIDAVGPLGANSISITDSDVDAAQDAVDVNFGGELRNTTITATINGNELRGGSGSAASVTYCGAGSCEIRNSTITVTINGNATATSDATAISATVLGADSSVGAHVNIDVNENDRIDSSDDTGVGIEVDLCCGDGENAVAVNVNGNGQVSGEAGGVDVFAGSCCGGGNTHNVEVYENEDLESFDGQGVAVTSLAGGIHKGGGGESDDNASNVEVKENGDINGDDDAINIDSEAGSAGGVADTNTSSVTVSGNGPIAGDIDDGIQINADSGSVSGSADGNTTTVHVNDNGPITGGDDGVIIDHKGGSNTSQANDNRSEVHVDGNGPITSQGEDGIQIEGHTGSRSGPANGNSSTVTVSGNGALQGAIRGAAIGAQVGSESGEADDNHSEVHVDDNGDIHGDGDDGVKIEMGTGGGAGGGNTSEVHVNGNGDIRGGVGEGVDIGPRPPGGGGEADGGAGGAAGALGDRVNTITVINNNGITGAAGSGLLVNVCDYQSGDAEALACLHQTVSVLTVSGNLISNSAQDGISLCCGVFQGDDGKSSISDNTVSANHGNGIRLDSVSGLNIGPRNVISANGSSDRHAGIKIVNDTSFQVWRDTDAPADPLCAADHFCNVIVAAGHNAITGNRIFDNTGPGIDLQGLSAPGGVYDGVSRVGCVALGKAAIDPNACVAAPVIASAGDRAGGSACPGCTVELFVADATPGDQTGPLGQYGEGATFLATGTANAQGAFSIFLPCGHPAGELTATGTDGAKNTSEFGSNHPFIGTISCSLPTNTPAAPTTTAPPTGTVASTATRTPTRTPAAPAKACGDVNDDGRVDSIDATLVLQFSAGLLAQLHNQASADANGDGSVSSVDATLILQANAGLLPLQALDC